MSKDTLYFVIKILKNMYNISKNWDINVKAFIIKYVHSVNEINNIKI